MVESPYLRFRRLVSRQDKLIAASRWLTLLVLAAGCASYPSSTSFSLSYGDDYYVRGSRDGTAEYLQRMLRKMGVKTRRENRADGATVVVTQRLEAPRRPRVRRERRVSYVVKVTPMRDPTGLTQVITVHCQVESKGRWEKNWTVDADDEQCATTAGERLDALLEELENQRPGQP